MSDQGKPRIVKVRLKLPHGSRFPARSKLRVRIEDVSAADRPSTVIAEKTVEAITGEWLDVEVPASLIDPSANYSAFLHVGPSESDAIAKGDFISPAVYPVLTRGAPDRVEAELVRV